MPWTTPSVPRQTPQAPMGGAASAAPPSLNTAPPKAPVNLGSSQGPHKLRGPLDLQPDDASDTIDQTSDIVDEACKTLLAEVLEWQGVTEGISFPDFRDADSDVQTSPDMSNKAIVASVVAVSPNDSDEDDMESNNTGDSGPTVAEAVHCVSVMRVFAEKRGLAEKLAHSISEFEAAVVAARPPRRQMKITDFVTQS
ncbi:hypothetical protein HPB51_005832 [Rhipicephalus microplus]|uniref:Uncharacterized protein n=1 Tax=Rhipicephalus microplus TaxID=6941 RepID=A0A9J6EFL6_RHIMP|nr:hypothetical protein HPB51_005832 [Rhipicephalus microplus]